MEFGTEPWYSDSNLMFSPCCYTEFIQKKKYYFSSYLHMGPLDIMLGPGYAPWLGGAEVGQSWPSASKSHGFIEPQRGSHFFFCMLYNFKQKPK